MTLLSSAWASWVVGSMKEPGHRYEELDGALQSNECDTTA